ncbi:DUF4430 domain-containing protein [Enterococcus sp. LJL98]
MKKNLLLLTAFTLGVVGLSGCTDQKNPEVPATSTQASTVQETAVATVIIQEDGKEITKKEVSFAADTVLYEIMSENFTIEDNDGFITAIDGIAQDEANDKYWMYDLNGEMAPKGAKEMKLEAGDEVLFKLEKMQ